MNWSLLIKTNNLKCPYYLYSDFFKYRVLNDQIWSRSDHFLRKIMIRSGSQKKDRPIHWKNNNKFQSILKAVKMGATPAQYGFVFGIANLSLFLFSPVFGKYGTKFGPKLCFNFGAVLQVCFCTSSDIVYSFMIFFSRERK